MCGAEVGFSVGWRYCGAFRGAAPPKPPAAERELPVCKEGAPPRLCMLLKIKGGDTWGCWGADLVAEGWRCGVVILPVTAQ